MKFFGSVAAVVDAVLLTGAQTVAGIKTFTSALVASAGIQLASLWNTNGTGASDVCVKVGTSTADGSVNATARVVSFGTGIGGTYVEKAFIDKEGLGLSSGWRVTPDPATGRLRLMINAITAGLWDNGTGEFRQMYGLRVMNSAQSVTYLTASSVTGEVELHAAGVGIVLASPDGTRYRLTIANGGAVNVAAA